MTTQASGLVFIEPKHALQARNHVRTTNGIVEVRKNEKFMIVLSNFSKTSRKLPKNMVIAYATRNPLGIFALDNKTSEKFEKVLNFPSTRKEEDVHEVQDQVTPEGTDKTTDPRWQDQLDLTHVDDQELRGKIIKMLEKHEDMWRPGKLSTVDATYHRIELEPGTKPIRQAPYRQGHKGRDIQQQEITKMLDAGVIEPTTSEWATSVVLVPKKDGFLRFCIDYRRLNA